MCTRQGVFGKIYKIVNKQNGKIYIGKTIKSIQERFNEHLKTARRWAREAALRKAHPYNSRLYPAIVLHGPETFECLLLEDNIPLALLDTREQFWIAALNTTDDTCGYNISKGGRGGALFAGHTHTKAVREKLSYWAKRNIKLDDTSLRNRQRPRTTQLQNLSTGKVHYITELPKGYYYPHYVVQSPWNSKIYVSDGQFYISLGCAKTLLLGLSVEDRLKILAGLTQERKTRRQKTRGVKKILTQEEHAILSLRQTSLKQQLRQHLFTERCKAYKIDPQEYILVYNKYKEHCPNKHLELYYNMPYSMVRWFNEYLGLVGGKSGHSKGKITLEKNNS